MPLVLMAAQRTPNAHDKVRVLGGMHFLENRTKYIMFYYLYEIKNNLNDKIYVGVHKTKNMDDGYMGSGKVIQRAIQKNGLENFTKTIRETFDNSEAMFRREKEVVTDEFLARSDTYNLRRGGFGGFDYLNKTGLNRGGKSRETHQTGWKTFAKNDNNIAKHLDRWRKIQHLGAIARMEKFPKGTFDGRLHSENTKLAIGEKSAVHQRGEGNSQYGTKWISNGIESKKIRKDSLVPEGWRPGRKQTNA